MPIVAVIRASALAFVKYKLVPSAKSLVVLFAKFSSTTLAGTNVVPFHFKNWPAVIPVKLTSVSAPTLDAPIRAFALASALASV